jgi:hypothetical protein
MVHGSKVLLLQHFLLLPYLLLLLLSHYCAPIP